MKSAVAAFLLLAAASRALAGDLDAELERLALKNGVPGAGAFAMRADSGEALGARRADETFPLASVTKLFTACAALEALGPDADLATRLWVLRGKEGEAALVAVGGGDPAISGRDFQGNPNAVFERWADALRDAGIRKITRIDLDETRFGSDHIGESWPADQLHEWYSAPAGALALNDDCVDVAVTPGKAGEPVVVKVSPDTAYVKIDNRCTTTADKSQHVVQVWRKQGTNTISISGKFLTGAGAMTESVTIDDPARFFGTVLRETLARKGLDAKDAPLNVLKAPFEPSFGDGQPLVHAIALRDAFRTMLQRSQNFYAEQAIRAIGPRGGTVKDCIAAARKPLAALGLAEADVAWLDGSGLSRGNRASPATVAKLLAAAARRPWAADLWNAMAVPGAEGTLSKRLAGLETTMRGKTGTIAGVSNLAGYVDTKAGRVAFAVLCSQLKEGSPPAMRFQDDVARLLSDRK
ncbi:MAG: D-alanyl-D-alanine carboxypeptidase/D-alanyl-D-alanine-endopeptidase [Planctomycetes bacterium]|nr:D-alanyl-D-alanine carboxypeptidase/D-alanyl-D-alanine-endopeptidase [Planctomycetota bacterium]